MSKPALQEIQGGSLTPDRIGLKYTTVRDNFLSPSDFDAVQVLARSGKFGSVHNPVDNVEYPTICDQIPDQIREAVEEQLGRSVNHIFLRRSAAGVPVNAIHHTDNSMGRYSLMLYITVDKSQRCGTEFVRHRPLGVSYAPEIEAVIDMLRLDQNNMSAWDVYAWCEGMPNRACMFDAAYFHRAAPVGGFGSGAGARCVLTAFYD